MSEELSNTAKTHPLFVSSVITFILMMLVLNFCPKDWQPKVMAFIPFAGAALTHMLGRFFIYLCTLAGFPTQTEAKYKKKLKSDLKELNKQIKAYEKETPRDEQHIEKLRQERKETELLLRTTARNDCELDIERK